MFLNAAIYIVFLIVFTCDIPLTHKYSATSWIQECVFCLALIFHLWIRDLLALLSALIAIHLEAKYCLGGVEPSNRHDKVACNLLQFSALIRIISYSKGKCKSFFCKFRQTWNVNQEKFSPPIVWWKTINYSETNQTLLNRPYDLGSCKSVVFQIDHFLSAFSGLSSTSFT